MIYYLIFRLSVKVFTIASKMLGEIMVLKHKNLYQLLDDFYSVSLCHTCLTCPALDRDLMGVQPESEGFFLPLLFYQGLCVHRRHVVTQPPTTNTAQSLQTTILSRPTAAQLSSLSLRHSELLVSKKGISWEEEEEEEELHAHKPGIVQHQSTLEFRIPTVLSSPLCSPTLILSSKVIHNK